MVVFFWLWKLLYTFYIRRSMVKPIPALRPISLIECGLTTSLPPKALPTDIGPGQWCISNGFPQKKRLWKGNGSWNQGKAGYGWRTNWSDNAGFISAKGGREFPPSLRCGRAGKSPLAGTRLRPAGFQIRAFLPHKHYHDLQFIIQACKPAGEDPLFAGKFPFKPFWGKLRGTP